MDNMTSIIIFGASGDLTQRKLVPALFNLHRKKRLPANFQVVGYARTKMDSAEFRAKMRADADPDEWDAFAPHLHYLHGNINPADLARLQSFLRKSAGEQANRLYYLSTPPRFFANIIAQLGSLNMTGESNGWRRVVIEKPFGYDLASARTLNSSILNILNEHQIYRIDHYLAKETVQNILVFRFANSIFEPIWNRKYIDHVQITAAETVDVGHRAGYYDRAGVLRDMFQNHLLQLMSMVAMEPPASFDADAIRNERVKLLSAIRPIPFQALAKHTVRAQYRGYRDAPGVADGSETPTYAALKLFVDNWRWQGVPFYLRSGKALAQKTTEIILRFNRPPHVMFPLPPDRPITANTLALCLQPHEGIHLYFEAKVPDTDADMRSVNMTFHYEDSFKATALPQAYERLLLEALEGDASLFTRGDGIELAWRVIDPILEGWKSEGAPRLATYEPGSWGPDEADRLLAQAGHVWRHDCGEHL